MSGSRIRGTGFAAAAAAVALAMARLTADGPGQSFITLQTGFTQELFGTTQLPIDEEGVPVILGGVAFAPDGDVWSAECFFNGTTLHRFDLQSARPTIHNTSTLHPESTVHTSGGCGLTNHPDGFIYSNSSDGVWKLDASTGLPVTAAPMGHGGNALGITVDRQTGHVIYVGDDCHPTLIFGATTCSIFDLDPVTGNSTRFAYLDKTAANVAFVDGIYFDPTGNFLFLANRGSEPDQHFLTILSRPPGDVASPTLDQLVQSVPMASEPDGVAFHGALNFVVTLDEEGDTMTRFDFPQNDYHQAPAVTTFAFGGFRGDLLQVGADGCIYGTQGRHFPSETNPEPHGTRYDDGTETTEDSIVKICTTGGGGFVPPTTTGNSGGGGGNQTTEPCPAPPGTPSADGGVSRNINSYVLFGYEELSFKGNDTGGSLRGVISGGHVGVNVVDVTPNNSSVLLTMGGGGGTHEAFLSDGSQVTADSARLDADSKLYDLFVNILMGGSAPTVRHSGPTPFSHATATEAVIAAANLPVLPGFAPGSNAVTVQSNQAVSLAPGTYGDVLVKDDGTLNLAAGEYTVRSLRGGRRVRINTSDQTVVRVAGDFSTNNGSYVGPSGTASFLVRSDAVKSNDASVSFGRDTEAHGQFFAPSGILNLGHSTNLFGRFVARKIGSDFNVNVSLVCPLR